MRISTFKKQSINKVALVISVFVLVFLTKPLSAQLNQDDNPYLDQVPKYLRTNPPRNPDLPLSSVITINNWDNFNLGNDVGESNIAAHLQNPEKYFTAYNINNGHHTENGLVWSNVTPNFGASMQGDPVVAYDSLGNVFYQNMYGSSSNIQGAKVIKSTDNGATWGTAVTGCTGDDKNWMACDQTNGPYANYVYVTMSNYISGTGGKFARSTDHGATFTNTFNPTSQSLPGMMVCVGAYNNIQGGAVYVVTNSGDQFAATYTFYRSLDGGATFSQKSAQHFSNYVGTNISGRNSVEGMRTRPYPFIAADNSFGPNRGKLYLVYASNDPPGNGKKPDIWCRSSSDGGSTWTSAVRVNDDPNPQSNHQWHPAIWCDKETGRLYAMWMDTRDCPTSDSALIYASYSDDGGQTFVANQAVSNKKMKINCPGCGGGTPRYQGDYNGIVSNKKVAQAGWTDFRQGNTMSVTGYFPDFAMAIDHIYDTLYTPSDSATFQVSIPAVKLYTDTVILSGVITPTPPSGSIEFHYPAGNTITTYPATQPVNVVLLGNVPAGTYTAAFYAAGPNGTPVHKRTATIKVIQGSGFLATATASPATICQGQNSQLNVTVAGGVSPFTYSWTPQTGLSDPAIANPVATPMVTTTYHILVTDASSHTSTDSVVVNVNVGPATPGLISGPQSGCLNTTSDYMIVEVPNASTYSWTVPDGDTIISGQNSTSISVLWRNSTPGNVSVIAGNDCGNSTPSVLPVTVLQVPAAIGSIDGPEKNCINTNATYSVNQGGTSDAFVWDVPPGVTIINGQGTNAIQVIWGTHPGDISVYAENQCGISDAAGKTISVDSIPSGAGIIAGKDTVCQGQNGYVYSVEDIPGALSYSWSVPAGMSINGTQNGKQITIDIGTTAASGPVSVLGINDCGPGPEYAKQVITTMCAGIPENIKNGNVSIYPNPTDQLLNIAFNSQVRKVTLYITDMKGREIHRESMENIKAGTIRQINVSHYTKGVYFMKLMNKDQIIIEKIVIQ